MQVFQKKDSVLGGIDEAIAILKLCSDDWDELTVHALYDGDEIAVGDGDDDRGRLHALRPPRDGLPGRARPPDADRDQRRRVLEAANGKPIIFMPARHDHHRVQTGDGYAAYVAGATSARRSASRPTPRRPGGAAAASAPCRTLADRLLRRQHRARGDEVRRVGAATDSNIVVLVDFENDSVRTALEVARALGPRLWGVRLDTSDSWSTARSGTSWATSTRAASTSGSSSRCATRSTATGSSG